MQDCKSSCDTLVSTQTHRQLLTGYTISSAAELTTATTTFLQVILPANGKEASK